MPIVVESVSPADDRHRQQWHLEAVGQLARHIEGGVLLDPHGVVDPPQHRAAPSNGIPALRGSRHGRLDGTGSLGEVIWKELDRMHA